MKASLCTLAALLLGSLAACDTIGGLNTSALLTAPMDRGCVSTELASVPGVTLIPREHSPSGRQYWPFPGDVPAPSQVWPYEFGGTETAIVETYFDDQGKGRYFNGLQRIGGVPREELDTLEPVMRQIDMALQTRCGLTPELTTSRRR